MATGHRWFFGQRMNVRKRIVAGIVLVTAVVASLAMMALPTKGERSYRVIPVTKDAQNPGKISKSGTAATVVDLQAFRSRKIVEDSLVRGRRPLYKSHSPLYRNALDGNSDQLSDFSEKITRIHSSLDKINALMRDLRKLSSQDLI